MIMTCSFVSCVHRTNLKDYILSASFCISHLFSVTPTFGVLLAIDLHLSLLAHTWWAGGGDFTLPPSGTDTGPGRCRELESPASTSPKDELSVFVAYLKKSRNVAAVLVN